MPYPSQINRETILHTAWAMIEAEGVEALSLAKLAAALGVKAPSLYRYFSSRAALLQGLNELTYTRLLDSLQAALEAPDPPLARLKQVAQAYRAFAHAHPVAYTLAFVATPPDTQVNSAGAAALVQPLDLLMTELVGEAATLPALRGAWALMHGFASLELNRSFQRGGSLDAAFEQAVDAYLRGWAGGG